MRGFNLFCTPLTCPTFIFSWPQKWSGIEAATSDQDPQSIRETQKTQIEFRYDLDSHRPDDKDGDDARSTSIY